MSPTPDKPSATPPDPPPGPDEPTGGSAEAGANPAESSGNPDQPGAASDNAGGGARRRVWLLVAGAVVVAVAVSGGAYLLRDYPGSCGGTPVTVTIAAAPEIAPALGEVAARFNVQTHEVSGRCVRVGVVARDPAVAARTLADGKPFGADGWIADSSIWMRRAGRKLSVSVASSPIVIAAPRGAGLRGDGWKVLRTPDATVRALTPSSAAGIATSVATGVRVRRVPDLTRLYGLFGGLPNLRTPIVAATEQSVVAYNDTHRPNPAAVIVPAEGTIALDYPYTGITTDPLRGQALDSFRWTLGAQQALATLQRHGFRRPDGRLDPQYAQSLGLRATLPRLLAQPTPAQIAAAQR